MSEDNKITQEAIKLLEEAYKGMEDSLEKFLPKLTTIDLRGRWPKSYLKYKDALKVTINVFSSLQEGDMSGATNNLSVARTAIEDAIKAFDDDEKMHKEIDEELDNYMGTDK